MIHIGIDFDNTIVCYDSVFYRVALEQNLIPRELSSNKTHIRDYFRSQGKEELWTILQGTVYGSRMDLATPFQGVGDFFDFCKKGLCKISIISHKTKYPYLGQKHDLHASAEKWLVAQPFFHSQISYYFELTLEKKLQRIEKESCDFFIDDLPELLSEPGFPDRTKKILFDPSNIHPENPNWKKITAWNQLPLILDF
jgi:hypothetical protein